ncbi:MAG TPA: hypothetical protein PLH94_15005 [Fimbriimonadaceae bacterium]|nr:hypothetical protein [Fimbriimonadaceae bacterium]
MAIASASIACAQPIEAFRRTYNAPSNHSDDGVAVAADGHGGCYVGGDVYAPTTGFYAARLVAYDPKGTIRWTFGDPGPDESERVEQVRRTPIQPDVWVLSRAVNLLNQRSLRLTRVTAAGQPVFVANLNPGTGGSEYPADLFVDPQGFGYVKFGRDGTSFAAKVSPAGVVLWETPLFTTSDSAGTGIVADGTGVFVAGILQSVQGGTFTAALSQAGTVLWTTTDSGPIGNTLGPAIVARHGGDVIVATSPETTFGIGRYRLTRSNAATGAVLWSKDYSPEANANADLVGMAVDRWGNASVTATRLFPTVRSFVVRYGADGARLWETELADVARAMTVDANGNIFVGTGSGWLFGLTRLGAIAFSRRRVPDVYEDLDADQRGNVFAAGTAFSSATNDDFVAVKLLWLRRIL